MTKLGFGTAKLQLAWRNGSREPKQEQINEMTDLFLDRGFLFFDTACGTKQAEIEALMSRALVRRHPRNRFYLSDHIPPECIYSNLDYEPFFQTQLERWNADYFDFYSLNPLNHFTYTDTLEYGGFEFLSRLKEEGRARHIGFFFNDKPELLDAILSDHPEMEFVQMDLNYQDWYDDSHPVHRCYETALRYRKPVIIADSLKGGSLLKPPAQLWEALHRCRPDWPPEAWALRFAASLPHVPVVFSQVSASLELKTHLEAMTEGGCLSEEEQFILKKAVK